MALSVGQLFVHPKMPVPALHHWEKHPGCEIQEMDVNGLNPQLYIQKKKYVQNIPTYVRDYIGYEML